MDNLSSTKFSDSEVKKKGRFVCDSNQKFQQLKFQISI